jgi:hypothetical protein
MSSNKQVHSIISSPKERSPNVSEIDYDYTWIKGEKTKEKLFDLKRLADTVAELSSSVSNPIPIELNSTKLLEQRLAYVRQLQFDPKQAQRDILEDVDDRNEIIYEASKVFYFRYSLFVDRFSFLSLHISTYPLSLSQYIYPSL